MRMAGGLSALILVLATAPINCMDSWVEWDTAWRRLEHIKVLVLLDEQLDDGNIGEFALL
jgi:hypothetical protein